MAKPAIDFLPALSDLLGGKAQLIPWIQFAEILRDTRSHPLDIAIRDYLQQPPVKQLFESTSTSFPGPNEESKKRLESLTAAIHVSPIESEKNDTSPFKEDALWLSKELKLSEIYALRIVLLEWQQRPFAHLESGYSETELASLEAAFGKKSEASSGYLDGLQIPRSEDNFSSNDARRQRQLVWYFQERLGFLSVLSLLAENVVVRDNKSLSYFAQFNLPDLLKRGLKWHQQLIESIQSFMQGPRWTVSDDDLLYLWQIGTLRQICLLMELVLIWVRASDSCPSSVIQQWVEVMADSAFLSHLEPSILFSSEDIQRMQLLTILVTIALLDPPASISGLNQHPAETWLRDANVVGEVHSVLFNAAEADLPQLSPAILAWALVLQHVRQHATTAREQRERHHVQRAVDQISAYDSATGRRTSFAGSGQQSVFEDIMDSVMAGSPVPEPTSYLLSLSVTTGPLIIAEMVRFNDGKFSKLLETIRSQVLQELTSVAFRTLGYREEIIASQLALLEPETLVNRQKEALVDPRTKFIESDFLMPDVFEVAAARFPHESLTFIRFCKCLAQAKIYDNYGTQYITFRLKALSSFSQVAIGGFEAYHTTREDENLNLVALEDNVGMIPQHDTKMLTYSNEAGSTMIIPAQTIGEVISEGIPPVIRWQFEFNGLSLLGKWLDLHYQGQLYMALSQFEQPSDVTSEIIELFSILLTTTLANSEATEDIRHAAASDLLNDASLELPAAADISQVIFNIFEQELQFYRRRPSNVFDTAIITSCIQYFAALIRVHPDQFWSLIGKTSFVNRDGGDSLIFSIINGVEAFSGELGLMESFVSLYQKITDNVFVQCLSYDDRGRKPSSSTTGFPAVSPSRRYGPILEGCTYAALDVFQFLTHLKANSATRKAQVMSLLSNVLSNTVTNAYGIGDWNNPSTSNSCILKSGHLVLSRLRSAEDATDFSPGLILKSLTMNTRQMQLEARSPIINDSVASLLNLADTVVRCANFLSLEPSGLESELLNAIPLLVRNLNHCQLIKKRDVSISLMRDVLESVTGTYPVSLLGHLGSATCISFLNVLKLVYGGQNQERRLDVFQLLVQLVTKEQQWLAVVVLSGSVPDKADNYQKRKEKVYRGESFTDLALTLLSNIETLARPLSAAVLKFVIGAQQNWSWVTSSLQSRNDVFSALVTYVSKTSETSTNPITQSQHNRLVALVTELCSIHLHYAKSVKDVSVMKTLIPLLNWLTSYAIEVSSYNVSLHANLRKNFAAKFGTSISTFKNSGFIQSSFGEDSYYLLTVADQVFAQERAWSGAGKDVTQSFSAEIDRANANLSVVESELILLRSFQHLCIEHCGFFVQDHGVQRTMAHIVHNSLIANLRAYPPEVLFDSVNQIRVNMSLALIQRLVEAGAKGSDFRNLLSAAWDAATFRSGSYDKAIVNDDLHYWRSMISVIVIALQFHIGKSWQPLSSDPSSTALLHHTEHSIPKILEIATTVIGQGFTSAAAAIQDQREAGEPLQKSTEANIPGLRDIVLIVNTFETILRMTKLPDFITQLSERLLSTNCIQASLALYSWSHLLAAVEDDNDLVYAKNSLRFLISLSSLPAVAEELAIEGLLSRLLTARVTQAIQKVTDGVSALDNRPYCQTLYSLWSEGFLPICLNLLRWVGAPVAAEVALFLNQFPQQLNLASLAFASLQTTQTVKYLSLDTAREASTLALISMILESYRNAGASAAIEPSSIPPLINYDEHRKSLSEDIRELTTMDKNTLKSKIIPADERETKWSRSEVLVDRVLYELRSAMKCLQIEENEEDKS